MNGLFRTALWKQQNWFVHIAMLGVLVVPAFPQQNAELQKLFRDYYEAGLRESPEYATSVGRTEYNHLWSDWSPKGSTREIATRRDFQKRLSGFRGANLGVQDRLSVELLEHELASDIEETERLRNYNVVNHFRGPHLRVGSMLAMAPARNVKDFDDRIARLRAIPALVDGMIAAAEQAGGKGMIPPRVVVDRLLGQLDAQRKAPASETPLLASFRSMPPSIPPAEQQRLRKAAEEAYTQAFQPAWQKYRNYVADAYLPKARASLAMSDLPDGKAHYAFLVRRATTTDMSPEQIHETGKREVERILTEMAAIRKEMGFTGTADEFNDKVLNAPEMRFKTEAEIVAHGREIAKRIDPELPRLFKTLPRMTYGVRAIPADRARTAAPYYEPPALDGTRAGNFYLRTADPQKQSKCCMQALIIHEAVPGHHLQIATAQELEGIPEFRRSGGHTAYIEGWGLYAESLGSELGMYENPYERYGRLQSEIMRALRLVTDTGLHHYNWTRDQAIKTMSGAKGGWITDEVVASEVDRYIAMPGQALAYKVGQLKISDLRRKAEKALGPKFDIRDFHDVVLRNGSLPLTILEREVDRWLAEATR
jgi:uncharacterized protein (DUF885 family)